MKEKGRKKQDENLNPGSRKARKIPEKPENKFHNYQGVLITHARFYRQIIS
jgi:hypothetical protein